jgi:hypothetical protein
MRSSAFKSFSGSFQHRLIASFVVIIQCMGIVGFAGHSHGFVVRLESDPAVATHDCGAHERHIPVDEIRACPLCWQLHQRNALPAPVSSPTALRLEGLRSSDPIVDPVVLRPYLFPQRRGPPVVA